MRRNKKKALALMLAVMTVGSGMTAYAGTWEEHHYDPTAPFSDEYGSGEYNYSVYNASQGERFLVGKDWRYLKDDGTYAVNEWIQDTDGRWYYLSGKGLTCGGYWTLPDGKGYFFDLVDNHMLEDAIVQTEVTVSYGLADCGYPCTYVYYNESGADEGKLDENTVLETYENGVSYLQVGNDRYQAVSSGELHRTYQNKVSNDVVDDYYESYTIYQKVK